MKRALEKFLIPLSMIIDIMTCTYFFLCFRAMGILVGKNSKKKLVSDLIAVYACGKQAIVFTQTKREADMLAGIVSCSLSCERLHGDIAQGTREITLAHFRDRKFSTLIATDVAARGLDIPSVDLVVHYDSPEVG